MDKLTRLSCFLLMLALVSCNPRKTQEPKVPDRPPVVIAPTTHEKLFPVPYFPTREPAIDGKPVGDLAGWTAACVYTASILTDAQKAWVAQLQPAGGEGKVAPGFTADFDGDGHIETVLYGAYAKADGEEGNFVLLTRKAAEESEVLLLQELPGKPQFTVFTLKPDGSLWFGGGIDAGEVTMKLSWVHGKPVFQRLSAE